MKVLFKIFASILFFYGSYCSAADTITIKRNKSPISVIVPTGQTVSAETQEHLQQIRHGNYSNLKISYAGPLHGKDSIAFKLMLIDLETVLQTKIHIVDPALRNDSPNWSLEDNLKNAAEALSTKNSIVICPVGDTSLFGEYNGNQTLRVTALEILSFLTKVPQVKFSPDNFGNIIGGYPTGGRLADPVQIGDELFYVFVPTEFILSQEVTSYSEQDLLDLWQIMTGMTIDPRHSHYPLPVAYIKLFETLMALDEEQSAA